MPNLEAMLEAMLRNAHAETRFLYEERAGMIEFCGNAPRKVAEREAAMQVFGAYPSGLPQRDDL